MDIFADHVPDMIDAVHVIQKFLASDLHLDPSKSGIDVATRLCRHPIREVVLKVVQPRRVNGYPFTGAAPEHLGNWSSRDLASDVPERHVERAEGVHARA